MKDGIYKVKHNPYKKYIVKKMPKDAEYKQQTVNGYPCYYSRSEDAYYFIKKEGAEMKKVNLLGLEFKVEFDESEIFDYTEADGCVYQAVWTKDDRLIIWNDAENSWMQIERR